MALVIFDVLKVIHYFRPVGKCLKVLQLLRQFRRDAPIEDNYKVPVLNSGAD